MSRRTSINRCCRCWRNIAEPPINTVFKWLRRAEDALLALLLSAMIAVAGAQVLLRNLFDEGLYWGDSAVRVMVLWVAMIGAMVASRNDEHIRIDLAGRYLPPSVKPYVARVVSGFVCVVLALFAWHSLEFIRFEYEDQTIAFGVVPAWMCEVIMPVGAAIMALRYAVLVVKPR